MRLQVFLSHSGVCSRRRALDLIKQGCVLVNAQLVCEPSFQVNPEKDKVLLEGVPIQVKRFEYIILNKPKGVTTTKEDKFAKKTVMDLLPKELQHLYPVGRLDKDTGGLLLLTNNGKLAHTLMHPSFEIDKVYWVEVKGALKENDQRRLEKGIILQGQKTAACKIRVLTQRPKTTILEITLHEGRKRQIRESFKKLGYPVLGLKRIKEGPIALASLAPGKWRALSEPEVSKLKALMSKRVSS
ncbi:MAG: pseudouridine synthase [Candidatus Omnitrophota bacterium]